ncbi:hypothetical protein LX66_3855 [Chitinophaga japonensis]|uniref:C2H2-type domain-containing protein n=1 Tax=Chitinophaga japonensis TaxID=104662 RepID=A0A562T0I4_CHIJA|nr:hypothetical protein LX66_3855 [Chitinophaga japonensis]
MELLWFLNPSLDADYGRYACCDCGTAFYYSPRLICHCNKCAIKALRCMLSETKDEARRCELQEQIALLTDCCS